MVNDIDTLVSEEESDISKVIFGNTFAAAIAELPLYSSRAVNKGYHIPLSRSGSVSEAPSHAPTRCILTGQAITLVGGHGQESR
ncbi:hypothetical protein M1O17_04415 [Dehalococcoidia bacterium]|nr:hypothetical protein [Dehalococcoidia bacterium]MCL0102382.1 hypothetical protein [Dehalococcoidia bacterium]